MAKMFLLETKDPKNPNGLDSNLLLRLHLRSMAVTVTRCIAMALTVQVAKVLNLLVRIPFLGCLGIAGLQL